MFWVVLRVPQGVALAGATTHEAYNWRYSDSAPLGRSPCLHWGQGLELDAVAVMLVSPWDPQLLL